MLSRVQIELELRNGVDIARAAYLIAKKDFDNATRRPTGLPHPDGVQTIKNAGLAHSQALRIYTDALMEQHRFIVDGLIPERFTTL